MNWEETQDALRAAIKAKRGMQSEIAKQLGVSRASVGEYVNGERAFPAGHISVILNVLGLELEVRPKNNPQA